MRCNPARWLWGLIPIAMLSWATYYREREGIEADLTRRATEAMAAAGQPWAAVTFEGRDAVITGRAADEGQPRIALNSVRSVWGVRKAELRTDIAAPPAVIPPAIGPLAGNETMREARRRALADGTSEPGAEDTARKEAEAKATAEAARKQAEAAAAAEAARKEAEAQAAAEAARKEAEAQAAAEAARKEAEAKAAAEAARKEAEAKAAAEAARKEAEAAAAAEAARKAAEKAQKEADMAAAAEKTVAHLSRATTKETAACEQRLKDAASRGTILFARAKSDIDAASSLTIARLAEIVKSCPGTRIEVEGHTDSEGEPERNQALSERRARAVVRSLVFAGVPSSRLTAVGYGAGRPVATNDTPEGMAKNRRIEFKVYVSE